MKELRETEWGKTLSIIILTGKEADDARMAKIAEWLPTYYFVKGNQNSDDFVSMLKDIAGDIG